MTSPPGVEYFAEGILLELTRLDKLLTQRGAQVRLKGHHNVILAYLEEHGFMTDKDYAKLVDRAKATKALDFKFLLDAGLIERRGRGPGTHYVPAEAP